jgi:hypothetical protein
VRPSDTDEIAILGMHACEARELTLAAGAVGLTVRLLAFGSPLADAAFAAHGPGSVSLPLAIIAGRYSLQRPTFGAVLECIEVVRGTRQTLPAGCVVLASTVDRRVTSSPQSSPENPIAFNAQTSRAWVGYRKAAANVADPSPRTSSAIS